MLTIPNRVDTSDEVTINCFPSSGDSYIRVGFFEVTNCPLQTTADEPVAVGTPEVVPGILDAFATSVNGEQFDGTDLSLSPVQDTYVISRDVVTRTPQSSSTVRVTIRSSDPSELIEFANELAVEFSVKPVNSSVNPDDCNSPVRSLTERITPEIPDESDIEVDFRLISVSGTAESQRNQYRVEYYVDPEIQSNIYHTYSAPEATGFSMRLSSLESRLQLSMWNAFNYAAVVQAGGNDLPPMSQTLYHYNPQVQGYNAAVSTLESSGYYELEGAFISSACSPDCPAIEDEIGAIVLNGGEGLSNGAVMNNGEMQIEGYCMDVLDYPGVTLGDDLEDWYCEGAEGNLRRLTNQDFNRICTLTYNRQDAFAVPDRGNRERAYNWRCLAPLGNQ
jgi:hypothetical protein